MQLWLHLNEGGFVGDLELGCCGIFGLVLLIYSYNI